MHSQENSAFPSPQSGNYIESGFISCILLPPLAAQQKTLHDPKSRSHYKQKQNKKNTRRQIEIEIERKSEIYSSKNVFKTVQIGIESGVQHFLTALA